MPGDPDLPVRAWDFAPWQAARLVSGAALEAARAWQRRIPEAVLLDVTWDLHTAFRDLGIALWRLSRFRQEPGPDEPGLHDPGSHIYRAGSATGSVGSLLRDRELLEHVRRSIAFGLPAGGDPSSGNPAVTAALGLADAAAMAFRIVGSAPSGTAPARDGAVGAFMRAMDNLDIAVRNLAGYVSGTHSARLEAAQAALEEAYAQLREALICSAVDFRQPGSGKQVMAMRERHPVLPNRVRAGRDAATGDVARLSGASFPARPVLEAIVQPVPHQSAPSRPRRRTR
jgi:hypothetical protein